jgi:DNA-directed RNA polymerase
LKQEYVLKTVDNELLNLEKKTQIFTIPTKLPMVCVPKPYTNKMLGGYLLNNDRYEEKLFITKKGYGKPSEISEENDIYNLVNTISSTPFKINKDLLNYINYNGIKQNLIVDPNTKHPYEELPTLKPSQKNKLASFKSKIILQETVLGIADFYSNFSKIYFPVRLDQRGRLYCTPNYFSYQSNELSKALIHFGDPSVIQKTDTRSVEYLLSYGVNCFGGKISKQSINKKLE